jgi:serine/threonine-protein kinase RsbW
MDVRAGLHDRLYCRFPADARAPASARRLLRDWLNTWRWPPDESDEVVLATSEAVTNAVEHAAASHVVVEAVIDPVPNVTTSGRPRRARVSVSDNGRWRPRLVNADDLRWGLALMRACTDLVELERTQRCTSVRLTSRPISWSSTQI